MTLLWLILWRFAAWRSERDLDRSAFWSGKAREWDRRAHPAPLTTGDE